ncbi:hypothetical protein Ahy_B01g052512 [Arachis hypogaea]|uniref:CASP-like protein n=1 Tax=Arachis hypogaea TaxID=3818 RepID=A0A445APU7_ARAHY|nr:hypothetical protein Ahy_B01g052512 [Arachis hypogaea]
MFDRTEAADDRSFEPTSDDDDDSDRNGGDVPCSLEEIRVGRDREIYLVTVMGLVIPWSITLLVVDAYSVFIKCLPHQRRLIFMILLGDMVLSYLSLAAACSTAGVTDLLLDADGSYCPPKLCSRYQLSAAMAFLSWFLSSASCLFNFWILPSL